jgi:sigma-E factor negative regulatory protein RseB
VRLLRLAAVVTGVGALMTWSPARALVVPEPVGDDMPVAQPSSGGLRLLEAAAAAAQAHPWTGTERVLSLLTGVPVVQVATTTHGAGGTSSTDVQQASLLALLARHYQLRIAGTAAYRGRITEVVEALRPGATAVAARFWLDRASGLLVRRDVLDRTGALLRRTELLSVRPVARPPVVSAALPTTGAAIPSGDRLDGADLSRLEDDGWPVVRSLPGDLDLYEARWLPDGLLHLSYSDGLSTLSLFVQEGVRRPAARAVLRHLGGGEVWQTPGEPERTMWAAEGHTWTLVSDAEPALVDEVVMALPHTSRQQADALPHRVWRGLSRVGAWLNPYD